MLDIIKRIFGERSKWEIIATYSIMSNYDTKKCIGVAFFMQDQFGNVKTKKEFF